MLWLITLLSAYVFFGLFKLYQSTHFILAEEAIAENNTEVKIVILIPVLREQEVILANIAHFSKLDGQYELIYITSEKENSEKKQRRLSLTRVSRSIVETKLLDTFLEKLSGYLPRSRATKVFQDISEMSSEDASSYLLNEYDSLPSTAEMIDLYLEENVSPNVSRVHYPDIEGVMAHQLNYALGLLGGKYKEADTYVIIYNADSVVPDDVAGKFRNSVVKGENVILQSSLFLDNYQKFPENWLGDIMRFVALAQTRWTLIHEIPRVRRQYSGSFLSHFESAHVVGHGTCISLKALLEIGGYPQNFTNEDLALGYFLSLKGYKIASLKSLENAESPNTLRGIIDQYKTWFYGAADYFAYRAYAIDQLAVSRYKATLWASINSLKACIWLLAPWIWLASTAAAFASSGVAGILVMILFFVHTSFSHFLIVRFLNRKKPDVANLKKIRMTKSMVLIAPLAYFVWGIGPSLSLKSIFLSKMLGKRIKKGKTER